MKREIKNTVSVSSIEEAIGNCFTNTTGEFAGQPDVARKAVELKKMVSEKKIKLPDFYNLVMNYLKTNNYTGKHIQEQLKKVKKFFTKKNEPTKRYIF